MSRKTKALGIVGAAVLAVGLTAMAPDDAQPQSTPVDPPEPSTATAPVVIHPAPPLEAGEPVNLSEVAEAAPALPIIPDPPVSVAERDPQPAAAIPPPPPPPPPPEWISPVTVPGGHITSPFGPRPGKPIPGVQPFHHGTDIGGLPQGTPVAVVRDGGVIFAGVDGTYGNFVLVQHSDGIQTGYAHLSAITVTLGQHVTMGTTIGLVGMTGAATGPHLHFEVRENGNPVDGVAFMAAHGVKIG